VIGGIVDGVDANRVESKLFEVGNVSLARFDISNRIDDIRRATRLIVDAFDVESLVTSKKS
jgi:hypothetical protein